MKSISKFFSAWIVATVLAQSSFAATTIGMAGDGETSLSYNAVTGEMRIQPDGMPVGLFQILSSSGIFTTPPPTFCSFHLPCGPHEMAWAALPAAANISDFSLGVITTPGLQLPFLLNDLTITVSGGFGTSNRLADLVYTFGGSQERPIIVPVNLAEVAPSAVITANLLAANGPVTWHALTPTAGTPAIAATLSSQGAFSWNPAGSARGPKGNGVLYSWTATATNPAGQDINLAITLRLVPEPATVHLIVMALMSIIAIRGRHRCNIDEDAFYAS